MTCCLKADSSESGYAKSVSENVFQCLLEGMKCLASQLAFPEIVTPLLIQLKGFLKKGCKNPEISKQFKGLIAKVC